MAKSQRATSLFDVALAARGKTKLLDVNYRWVVPERYCDEWRRPSLCISCGEKCLLKNPVLNCRFCPSFIHKGCHCGQFVMSSESMGIILEVDSKFDDSIDWVCEDCCKELQTSRENFEHQKESARTNIIIGRAQSKIAALWRARQSRNKYKSMLNGIMLVQKFVRRMIRRRDLRAYRMKFYRPIKVIVHSASNLSPSVNSGKCDSFVIVTVLDANFKQIWRFDTFVVQDTFNPDYAIRGHPEANSHIFGGLTAYSFIVLSVFDQDPIQSQFLGQAVIRLQDGDVWRSGGRFSLPLTSRQYSVNGFNANYVAAAVLKGVIHLELKAFVKVDSMCGNLIGPDLDLNFSALTSRSPTLRTANIWAMLADGLLHIYPYFSCPYPKLILNLAQVEKITFYCYSQKAYSSRKMRSKLKLQSLSTSMVSNDSSLLQADVVRWQRKLRKVQSTALEEGFDDAMDDDGSDNESKHKASKRSDFKPHFEIVIPDSGICYAFKALYVGDVEAWRTALFMSFPNMKFVCADVS